MIRQLIETLDARVMAGDQFDSLGKEDESIERRIESYSDPQLSFAVEDFRKMIAAGYHYPDVQDDQIWPNWIRDKYEKISARTIERFSLVMGERELSSFEAPRFFSLQLNRLIDSCHDEEISIHTKHHTMLLEFLGANSQAKRLVIYGNVGDYLGKSLQSGSILVHGNVGDYVGDRMTGGHIHVNGNVGYTTGGYMRGGKIVVDGHEGGNAGYRMDGGEIVLQNASSVGTYMRGGIIRVEGDLSHPNKVGENAQGGEIYYRGKLIMENGRRIQ